MKIGNSILLILVLSIQPIINGCSRSVVTTNQPVDMNPPYKTPSGGTYPIQLKSIALELPEEHKLGKISMGVLCIPMTDLISIWGKAQVSESDFTEVVRKVLANADYDITDDRSVSSASYTEDGGLVLQGTIKDLQASVCFPKSGFRSWKVSKGTSTVKIQWQIYSEESDEMLFEAITEGSAELSRAIGYGITKVILGSVADATENLIADEQFNMLLSNSNN